MVPLPDRRHPVHHGADASLQASSPAPAGRIPLRQRGLPCMIPIPCMPKNL
ncbi:hypothetical protein DESPIG_03093 [Desulfovibrio piger ATCC 29098]|uniref:Uncharacterized protein n=1 Tax=Desulfovibrio piger ATCC 29098 TaxID=411464 RepID=B6WYB2_9BACT|nr:hypothetical protein DESPIG_03093 [Desulfovibrio piger ATCC 29098]